MRIKHIALFAAAAASAAVSFAAGAAPQGVAKEVVEVRGATHQQLPMAAFVFDRVQGEYTLEDGRVLEVKGKVTKHAGGQTRTLYADLGDGPIELVHVGRSRFVAVDKDVRVRFQGGDRSRMADTVFVSETGKRELAATSR